MDGLAALLPDDATVTAFLLVLTRTTAWILTAPVFSARGVSSLGRLGVGVALALFLTPVLPRDDVPTDLPGFAAAALGSAVLGIALGFLTALLFAAFEVAGTLVDLSGGFAFSSVLDPLSGSPAAAFARLFTLCFGAVFFVTDAYRTVVTGFVASFGALPLGHVPSLGEDAAATVAHAVTQVLASAILIAAPLLGVLFLTDMALGIAARFVPQANALALALPVKSLVALAAAGATLALLPAHAASLLEPALRLPGAVLR